MSDRKYRRKAPIAIRVEAEELARIAARDREACGDPEGAGEIYDLADRIAKISLSEPR